MPFHSLWLQPAPLAGARALSALVAAGLLAGTLASALRRAGLPFFRVLTSLLVVGCYVAVPLLSSPPRSFDATNALLAMLACGFALRIERWLARLDQLQHGVSQA